MSKKFIWIEGPDEGNPIPEGASFYTPLGYVGMEFTNFECLHSDGNFYKVEEAE